MKMKKFWMVLRLSKSSNEWQNDDSMPHKKHDNIVDAYDEAKSLTKRYQNAKGFAVLEFVGGYYPNPVPTIQEITIDRQ